MRRIKEVFIIGTCLLMWAVLVSAWTYTYDTDTPLGSDAPSVIDDRIRETKDAIQERMDVCGYWPLTGTEVSDADAGKFRYLIFREPNDLTSMSADESALFSKDANSLTELHWIDESDNVLQLTSGGQLYVVTASIAAANVTLAKMADNSIDSDQYVDGSIDTAHIADANITAAKIANLSPAAYAGGETTTFANGLIIKLGTQATVSTGGTTTSFGTAFPTACITVVVCDAAAGGKSNDNEGANVKSFDADGFTADAGDASITKINWVAFGY